MVTLFPFLQTLCCLRLLEGTRLQKVMLVHFVEPRSGSCMQSDESEGHSSLVLFLGSGPLRWPGVRWPPLANEGVAFEPLPACKEMTLFWYILFTKCKQSEGPSSLAE